MQGGHFSKFKKTFRLNLVLVVILNGITILAVSYFLFKFTEFNDELIFGILAFIIILLSVVQAIWMSSVLTKPTELISQAIYHISPNEHLVSAPDMDKLGFGKELVTSLTRQMYDMAANHRSAAYDKKSQESVVDLLPVGVVGVDKDNRIKKLNQFMIDEFGLEEFENKKLDEVLKISFPDKSIENWHKNIKDKSINANSTWNKIEVSSMSSDEKNYYDISASLTQNSASGIELIVIFFPRSQEFHAEQTAIDLLSLSVHEIRTPLTIMRGYIEALKQDLAGKVDESTAQYIERMSTSSQNLSSYMANILNVAKADQNELKLQLTEADWSSQLNEIVNTLQGRAKVRGKTINLNAAKQLPKVALDSVSINEVVTNLVENAIKYSPEKSTNIYIEVSLENDGSVLTSVRDEGVGIPDSLVKNLFTRFYRDHRNKDHVSGSGLGLYISKEIVSAHHGNIWVKSKEGQGTTVSFTLLPYSKLAEATKNNDNKIVKPERGWINNHSMQRR